MADDICLTQDEADALREVLAMLATIEERGLRQDRIIEISREMWRDMLLRPASRLSRIGSRRRLEARRG